MTSRPRRVTIRNAVLHRDGEHVDSVRLRYRSAAVPATVAGRAGTHTSLEVELGESFDGVAPGQTAVLLREDTVVGHGTISG